MHCGHFCCLPNIHAPILKRSEAIISASFTSGRFSWFHLSSQNTKWTCFYHQDIVVSDPFHWRMNVSCDGQVPSSPITKKGTKTRLQPPPGGHCRLLQVFVICCLRLRRCRLSAVAGAIGGCVCACPWPLAGGPAAASDRALEYVALPQSSGLCNSFA